MRPNSKNLALRDSAAAVLLGAVAPHGADFGNDYSFGHDYSGFGADAPTPENMQRAWQEKQETRARERLLSPNAGSSVKIQRYAFGVTQTLTLSTAVALSMSGRPETNFRPQRVTANAPLPAFCRISSIKVANVGVIVGGEVDAFDFAANGWDQSLDVPTISPANTVTVTGNYDGLLPDGGYVTATSYRFIVSFKGPANMAGS